MSEKRNRLLAAGFQIMRIIEGPVFEIQHYGAGGWSTIFQTDERGALENQNKAYLKHGMVIVEIPRQRGSGEFPPTMYEKHHNRILRAGITIYRGVNRLKGDCVITMKTMADQQWGPFISNENIVTFENPYECRETINYLLNKNKNTIED